MSVNFWILPNSGLNTASHIKAVLAEFNRAQPDINVNVSVLTRGELWKKLFQCQRESKKSTVPDIIEMPHYWTALFARLGVLADISQLDPQLSISELIEPLKPHCSVPGGKGIYSLPWWMDVSALHYRADHLKRVTSDPESLLKDWGGFLKACEILHKKKRLSAYYPVENANARGSVSIRDMLPSIWNFGGDIFTPDCSRSTIHREEAVRGMESYLDLFRRGFMPLLRERGSLGTLSSGKASMVISRRQAQATFSDMSGGAVPVRTLPIPGELFGSHSYLSSYNLALVREGQSAKEALCLLKWLAKGETQAKYSRLIHAFPCTVPAFEKFIFSSHDRMRTYAQIVGEARTLPNITVCGTYVEILDEILARISREIVRGGYSQGMLLQEMVKVEVEINYLLALYGD